MRLLHFDIISGISGDMTLAALSHLGAPIEPLRQALDAMGFSRVKVSTRPTRQSGIGALRFEVQAEMEEPRHRSLADVLALIDRASLSAGAHGRAEAIFRRLAEAEGRVHGIEPDRVSFHEVGAIDSIADVVGFALAVEHLHPGRITSSPTVLGSGTTECRHGPIPVPAPATVELLKGVPVRGLPIQAELTTPTGAAILATQVDRFGDWPAMRPEAIGYGAGSREIPDRPNLLRAVLGVSDEADEIESGDELLVEANIDDMSPEHYEHLMDRLFEAGAHDVWLQPVQMKKSRPAVVVSLLCSRSRLEQLEHILFVESSTIGLRRQTVCRRKLARRDETVQTPWGPVRVKIAGEGGEIYTVSPEYEDCRALARKAGVPLHEVYTAARTAWNER